ncbi:MAG: RNA methyltransferase [Bacteroidetes bacterium]|nr:RNA methyltransferase [Bacteroidota bacterium]
MASSANQLPPIPEALLQSLASVPGFERRSFMAAQQQAAVCSVRLHPLKGYDLFPEAAPVPWHPLGRYLDERPLFTADPLYHAGAYYVQEASSMLLHHCWQSIFSEKKTPLRVLDLCAAPGGKSSLLASLLDEKDLLISNEVIRSRAGILHENMSRWGYTNTWVTSNDPRDFGRLPGYFDALLIDAPCSGSGLFRKDVRALTGWAEANVSLCASRQKRIIADAWPCLKEGGVLIYATCSFSPEEDEDILRYLTMEYPVASIAMDMPAAWGVTPIEANGLRAFRCFPDRMRGEGFFIAALRKEEPAAPFFYPRFRKAALKKADEAARYLLKPGNYAFQEDPRQQVSAIYPWHEPDFHFLDGSLYLRRCGLNLGQAAQKDWIPGHDLALSIDQNEALPKWPMSQSEALNFLKKESLEAPVGIAKGWCLASYKGRSLGWLKVLGNRVNNYLPKGWRIRMDLPEDEDPLA